ncbi:MAG: hydantoinase B/oxoprolinase family protein [Candidatus Bathyarchaeia archaeon]
MIDPTTVEVIKGALIYAAEEMGIALRKSAYSPNIKERMDHSCAIFDSRRRLIAQAEHIPVHLGSMALAVREGLDEYKGTLDRGDMVLLNDPYLSGTHLPDLTLIAPIFYKEELIGYSANKAHHTDIGGKAPGSLAGDATELYQEGLIIPPLKFVKNKRIVRDISNLIRCNVRTPDTQMGDLRAQIAANVTGARRVRDLTDRYSLQVLRDSMQEIMKQSERLMRSHIKNMPEGCYSAMDVMEDVGSTGRARIRVTITIKGSKLTFDYSGTSEQVEAPVNAPLGVTIAGIYYTLISITDPYIPVNDGCFRPITLSIPEGCMMNPKRPAPVAGGNVETSQRNVDVLMLAFSEIIPEKIPAAGLGTMNNVSIGGIKEDGTPWTFYETIGGGSGGRPNMDGVDGVHVNMTNTMNTPIEALEGYLPLEFMEYQFRPDSSGAGRYRGGCGITRSWRMLSRKATVSIMGERTKVPPWGLKGGKPGAMAEYILIRNGVGEALPSKCTISLERGDILVIKTPGGGGYGDPLQREPKRVLRDYNNGLISVRSAEEDYGVIIDQDTGSLDLEATENTRKKFLE